MTKGLAVLALATLLAVPAANAQMEMVPPLPVLDPVPAAREIENLTYQDDDWEAFRNQHLPEDPFYEGAWDLRGMYYREAYIPGTNDPALVIRLLYEGGDPGMGELAVGLSLSVGDQAVSRLLSTTDGTTFKHDLNRVDGPFTIADRYSALDLWLTYASLGVKVGDEVKDIVFMSQISGRNSDAMPGGWYYQGTEMQWMTVHWPPGGTWLFKGPAGLFEGKAEASADRATLTLSSPLTNLTQQVTYVFEGDIANGEPQTIQLAPGQSLPVEFQAPGGTPPGIHLVDLVAWSDLGGRVRVPFQVEVAPPLNTTAPTPDADHEHEHTEGKDAPGLPPMLLLAGLVLVIMLRRRE